MLCGTSRPSRVLRADVFVFLPLGWDYFVCVVVVSNLNCLARMLIVLLQPGARRQAHWAEELCGELCLQAEYAQDYEDQVEYYDTCSSQYIALDRIYKPHIFLQCSMFTLGLVSRHFVTQGNTSTSRIAVRKVKYYCASP